MVNPYGRFELDMNSRLDLHLSIRATAPAPRTPQGEAAAAPCHPGLRVPTGELVKAVLPGKL